MSNIPKISVAFSDGNLLQNIANIDGEAAFIGTGLINNNIGKVFVISSLTDAEGQGITIADEPIAHRQLSEFYAELGGNQEIFLLLVANTVTMAQMLDYTSPNYANKLIVAGEGKIAYLGVFKSPAVGYNGGNDYIDSDVHAAITAAKTLVGYQNTQLKYLRVIIEGRVIIANETSTTVFSPNTAGNGFAGVVIGGSLNDGSASVGAILGRKVAYAAHIKIGKVSNGALQLSHIYIGTKPLKGNSLVVAAAAETKAAATVTVNTLPTDGDQVTISAGGTTLGNYTKITGDGTVTAIATAIKNAINTNTGTHGYVATSALGVVTIKPADGQGATANGRALTSTVTGTFAANITLANFAGGVDAILAQTSLVENLYGKGFIGFVTYPNKAGFYPGIDYMATTGDYSLLVRGAVVDAAAKIAVDVFINDLEGEVDTNADGTILDIDATHLEDRVEAQVKTTLGDRISGFTAQVDRTVNITATSVTKIKLRVQPKGYNTFIEVDLGLTA